MNTDNCTISGETIDYGPCAFLDDYQPDKVFSSIDHAGRYAYGNQPSIVVWNLAQLATALIQQLDNPQEALEEATAIIHAMPSLIEAEWLRLFRRKIGLVTVESGDMDLISDLLQIMAENKADFTNTFLALGAGKARSLFEEPRAFDAWQVRWKQRLESESGSQIVMRSANPQFIPRNHRIEEMITAALEGDFSPFHRLNRVLAKPYEAHPKELHLQAPPRPGEEVQATFCGT